MKKIIALLLATGILFTLPIKVKASDDIIEDEEPVYGDSICKDVKSAILIEAQTGEIIYEKNASDALPPASVTKIMTLLLVAEALEEEKISADQTVTVSAEASAMGGSQVFLKEGEEFTVEELLKCAVIASANDASVALAELIGGTESAFVSMMNERAKELGLSSTNFENCTGLDDTVENHLTSAKDISIMSRELIKHPIITKYSSTWQDSIRDGEFILTNTNRLVRYYKGCTGLKTGSTDKAGFCLSATAERDGMQLIAVVMGAATRDERNNCARALLDYGFAEYAVFSDPEAELESAPVVKGEVYEIGLKKDGFSYLCKKGDIKRIEKKYDIPEKITAPCNKDEGCGSVKYYLDGELIGQSGIFPTDSVDRISVGSVFVRILKTILVGYSAK